MQIGVYRHKKNHMLYQFVLLARGHESGEPDIVIYIPLRIEPEWAGTLRFCYRTREAFEATFDYVAEGLPVNL